MFSNSSSFLLHTILSNLLFKGQIFEWCVFSPYYYYSSSSSSSSRSCSLSISSRFFANMSDGRGMDVISGSTQFCSIPSRCPRPTIANPIRFPYIHIYSVSKHGFGCQQELIRVLDMSSAISAMYSLASLRFLDFTGSLCTKRRPFLSYHISCRGSNVEYRRNIRL